jgi:hypothetical protein
MQQMTRVQAIKTFLEKGAESISSTEFMAFWKVCSEDERIQFATVSASQLGVELNIPLKCLDTEPVQD